MGTEKLKEFVENSELPKLQKNMLIGFIARAKDEEQKRQSDRQLIEQIANEKKYFEIVLSNDEVKIFKVQGKDEWDTKYPYRSILIDKSGKWVRSNVVSPTFDLAYLVYLQIKHLGFNSQFVDFAMKMLEIKD